MNHNPLGKSHIKSRRIRRAVPKVLALLALLNGAGYACRADDIPTGEFLVKVKPIRMGGLGMMSVRVAGDVAGRWRVTRLMDVGEAVGGSRFARTLRNSAVPVGGTWLLFSTEPEARPFVTMIEMGQNLAQNAGVHRLTPLLGWDGAYNMLNELVGRPKALRSMTALPAVSVEMIEPNYLIDSGIREEPMPQLATICPPHPNTAEVGAKALGGWPDESNVGWYLDDNHSQLKSAREVLSEVFHGAVEPVTIAQLDTGYDPCQTPRFFDRRLSITLKAGGDLDPGKGGIATASHGAGSLGILAGQHIRIEEKGGGKVLFNDVLGGAPDAKVFSVNIHAASTLHVVYLAKAAMATAIDYAISQGADVITLSAGGVPSELWADAVNKAYNHGVPIFAASGDYFTVPLLGLPLTPYRTVYPAAFPNVEAVTGVTCNYMPYGRPYLPGSLLPWNWASSIMRGNWGPPSSMNHAIAAYVPNVLWPALTGTGASGLLIDLNGQGTSSATPQAAAAAALYIAYHHGDLEKYRGNWKRAEAVYRALESSADADKYSTIYRRLYIGRGTLRAKVALGKDVNPGAQPRQPAVGGLKWLRLLLPVDFEGFLRKTNPELSADALGSDGAAVRDRMLAVEAAQVIAKSQRLQDLVYNPAVDGRDKPPNEICRQVAVDMSRDGHCSAFLKSVLQETVRTKPLDAY